MARTDEFIAEKRRCYGRQAARAVQFTHVGAEAAALGLVGLVTGIGALVAAPAFPAAVWGAWLAMGGLLIVAGLWTAARAKRAAQRAARTVLGAAPVRLAQAESAKDYASFCRRYKLRPQPFDDQGVANGPVHCEPAETDRVVDAWLAAGVADLEWPMADYTATTLICILGRNRLPSRRGVAHLRRRQQIFRTRRSVDRQLTSSF